MKKTDTLKIGISGVRGIIGESLFPDDAMRFAQAFATFLKKGTVVISSDTRTSRHILKNAVVSGILSCGLDVIDLDIATTPTSLLAVRHLRAAGGIIITASHNPACWNGLKFVSSQGVFLNDKESKAFLSLWKKGNFTLRQWDALGEHVAFNDDMRRIHGRRVFSNIDVKKIRNKKFRVVVDCCNGAGSVITKSFLEDLGCRVIAINDTPNGVFPHPAEPIPENLAQLARAVRSHGAAIGFAQDPDADRLAIVDEKGTAIGEENTLALAVRHVLAHKTAGFRKEVVVNLSTSRRIEDIARAFGARLIRTPVGEANVVDALLRRKATVGGEGNGGVIYPAINPCRDSFVGMGLVLESLAQENKSVSALVKKIPSYCMSKTKVSSPRVDVARLARALRAAFKGARFDTQDGVRIDFENAWAHIRPSNTEPVMRIVLEAPTAREIRALHSRIKSAL
jgi:phosphomannomutase